MDKKEAREKLVGCCVPVVTFYDEKFGLSLERLRQHVNFLLEGGIKEGTGFLLVAGAGGDFPLLSVEERKLVIKTVVEEVHRQIPIIVGAQDSNPYETLELVNYAVQIGADGVQISPPYYFTPSDEDIFSFFKWISSQTKSSIMIYNTPWEGKNISLELLEKLTDLPSVVAVKWASQNFHEYNMGLYRYSEKVAMINNLGASVWGLLMGCTGFITHLANVWPEHEVQFYNDFKAGAITKAMKSCREDWLPWYNFRSKIGARTAGESPVVKAALELVGQPPSGPVRLPSRALTNEERAELRSILLKAGAPVKI